MILYGLGFYVHFGFIAGDYPATVCLFGVIGANDVSDSLFLHLFNIIVWSFFHVVRQVYG